ncbi:ABC transporter substrate-binding protein [Cupriavidus sp. WKF15]|uniref:ABC transporter substrate-binding protein n=1 Tax=Cupriavidus sp. WKF15 TaxID=3032282 RepID=UPI0023E11C99|nr:ABC transporter substrate-binding protein [Cupriavidus sp. WKF15]WER49655.1 ABC transporter substrate-binding protein [Cupriavidus sp. WKF15]
MLKRMLTVLTLSLSFVLPPSEAQQPAKIPRVGFLAPQGRSLPLFDAFRQGLADLGYIDGKNIVIEPRFAEGHYERFPEIFSELVGLKIDVLAVTGAVTARAAKKSVTDIPIVFSVVVDPVADHLVPNLERPGGNLTGVTSFDPQQATKQLELLKQVVPGLKRVAILGDQGVSEALINAAEGQARTLELQPQRLRVAGPNPDLEGAFAAIKQQHADALLVLEEPILGVHAKEVVDLAAKNRLPTLFAPSRVAAGGLVSYGASQTEAIRHMAAYVDKVLKGAKPGALSVETVKRYELIVNLKTAREIGVTVSPEVLKRADRVIQ